MNQERASGSPTENSGQADIRVTSPSAIKITPNRRSVDNRFPILGFTIVTGELPYFEVLLTVDRTLFVPQNAGRRHAGNFYASRQDSGLIRATGPESIYLVPPAVLRSFAQAQPHPSAIFYTLAAYRSTDGSSPVFAHPAGDLSTAAPSVAVASDFTGQTLAMVLGIPAEKLQHVAASRQTPAGERYGPRVHRSDRGDYCYATEQPLMLDDHGAPMEFQEDQAEGEDGYAAMRSGGRSEHAGDNRQGLSIASSDEALEDFSTTHENFDARRTGDEFTVHEHNGYHHRTMSLTSENASRNLASEDFAYEDGYEEYGPIQGLSAAQDSTFPVGALEPEPLSDDEQPYGEDLSDEEPLYRDNEATPEAFYSHDAMTDEPTDDDAARFVDEGEDEREAAPQHEGLSYGSASLTDDDGNYERYDDTGHYAEPEDDDRVEYEAAYDDDEQELTYQALDDGTPQNGAAPPARLPLTIDAKRRIIERIAPFESGRDRYSAINADGEFEGRFGNNHPAYQRYHIGLSYGAFQFTQDSGLLGRLLTMMRARDPQMFAEVFGPHADELIRVTTAPGPPSSRVPGGRSARVQPVAGADLWREPWVSHFHRAGQHMPFQAAQNELASVAFLDPMLQFAGWLALDTDRALTMVVDRTVQLGRGGAQRWIISAVGPVQTMAQQQQTLAALGVNDLRQFQRARNLRADGEFTPPTHAAMVAALRDLGARSPLPIPTREQMLDAMVRQAEGRRWAHRVRQLRGATDFTDTLYQI